MGQTVYVYKKSQISVEYMSFYSDKSSKVMKLSVIKTIAKSKLFEIDENAELLLLEDDDAPAAQPPIRFDI